jgi:hypothetical protein
VAASGQRASVPPQRDARRRDRAVALAASGPLLPNLKLRQYPQVGPPSPGESDRAVGDISRYRRNVVESSRDTHTGHTGYRAQPNPQAPSSLYKQASKQVSTLQSDNPMVMVTVSLGRCFGLLSRGTSEDARHICSTYKFVTNLPPLTTLNLPNVFGETAWWTARCASRLAPRPANNGAHRGAHQIKKHRRLGEAQR